MVHSQADKNEQSAANNIVVGSDVQLFDLEARDARIRDLELQNYPIQRIVDAQKDYASDERMNFTSNKLLTYGIIFTFNLGNKILCMYVSRFFFV